jgi:hypothetical protein
MRNTTPQVPAATFLKRGIKTNEMMQITGQV